MNLTTIKLQRHAGVDDLEGDLNGQATEWWTDLEWAKYKADEPNRKKRNEDRIAKLKADGEYGKEYEISCSFVPNPLFDEPKIDVEPTMSSSFFIFNISNNEQDKED